MGIKKENFLFNLQEIKFRYNTQIRQQDLYKILAQK